METTDFWITVIIVILAVTVHFVSKAITTLIKDNNEMVDKLEDMDKTICSLQAKCWNLEKRLRVFEDIVRSHQK